VGDFGARRVVAMVTLCFGDASCWTVTCFPLRPSDDDDDLDPAAIFGFLAEAVPGFPGGGSGSESELELSTRTGFRSDALLSRLGIAATLEPFFVEACEVGNEAVEVGPEVRAVEP
jgi:hypothetical protein